MCHAGRTGAALPVVLRDGCRAYLSRRGELCRQPRRRTAPPPCEALDEHLADVIDLVRLHLGIHRQAQDLRRGLFGDRERSRGTMQMLVGDLLMQRQRIVEPRGNPPALQELAHALALGHANDEEVVNRNTLRRLRNYPDLRDPRQTLAITNSDTTASAIPLLEVAQLDSQQRGLEGIETPVVALDVMVVLLRLPMLAQLAHEVEPTGVVRSDRSRLAARTQVLPRVEREGRHRPHRPG